jgi:hypothetical protein
MTTWAELTTNVLASLDDVEAVFHTTVPDFLREAELLLILARVVNEKTATFPLDGRPLYPIHTVLPDCMTILRASYNGKVLIQDHLASINLLFPTFMQEFGEPESFSLVGGTHVLFHPIPEAGGNMTLTYLAAPSASSTSPALQTQWHTLLHDYARGIALAKEAQYQRAIDLLKQVAEIAGIPDTRLKATDRDTTGEGAITDIPTSRPED